MFDLYKGMGGSYGRFSEANMVKWASIATSNELRNSGSGRFMSASQPPPSPLSASNPTLLHCNFLQMDRYIHKAFLPVW